MRCENNPVNSRIHGLRRSGEHNATSNDVQRSLPERVNESHTESGASWPMLQSVPANQWCTCRVSCVACHFVDSHLFCASLKLEAETRTLIKTSMTRSVGGQVSGSLSTYPHGDLH